MVHLPSPKMNIQGLPTKQKLNSRTEELRAPEKGRSIQTH